MSALSPVAAQLLETGIRVRLPAGGHSMTPWIRNGQTVELEPLRGRVPRAGDVVLVAVGAERFLCHRLIRVVRRGGGTWLVTKGDWLGRPDRPVPLAACRGRVPGSRLVGAILALASLLSPGWTPIARDWLAWKAGR